MQNGSFLLTFGTTCLPHLQGSSSPRRSVSCWTFQKTWLLRFT